MNSISTKTGDKGTSVLANGQRLNKHHPVFEAVGTLDELNAWLGLLVAKFNREKRLPKPVLKKQQDFLIFFQKQLFIVSAELVHADKVAIKQEVLTKIENLSEAIQKSMKKDWHQKFLLPGGTIIGANVDIARTICRRAERTIVALNVIEPVRPLILQIINRFSDYLYMLRCYVNWQLKYQEKEFNK